MTSLPATSRCSRATGSTGLHSSRARPSTFIGATSRRSTRRRARRPALALLLLLAAIAVPVASRRAIPPGSGAARPLSPLASVRAVGSGPIAWGRSRCAARRAAAPRSSPRFASSGRTSTRARCWRSTSAGRRGNGDVVPDLRPGPAERPDRLDPRRRGRRQARRPLARGLPRARGSSSSTSTGACADRAGCRRGAGDGDADRALLRSVDVRAERVPDPRRVRVRDERRTRSSPTGRAAASSESTGRTRRG